MSGHIYVLGVSMPVPSQESEWPCLCVRGIDFTSFFYDLSIEFWNCSDDVLFIVFIV